MYTQRGFCDNYSTFCSCQEKAVESSIVLFLKSCCPKQYILLSSEMDNIFLACRIFYNKKGHGTTVREHSLLLYNYTVIILYTVKRKFYEIPLLVTTELRPLMDFQNSKTGITLEQLFIIKN